MANASPTAIGAHDSGDEGVGFRTNGNAIASKNDFLECKLRLSRKGGKLCLALTLSLSILGLTLLVWLVMGVGLASKGWGAARPSRPKVRTALQGTKSADLHPLPADQHSQQGWRCPQGTAASDQPVDNQLFMDQKVTHHPNGLTFRTAVFEDNSFGARSAQFTRDKSTRIESGVWEADQDPYMQKAFDSDPNCEYPLFIDGGAAFGYYSLLAMSMHSCRKVHAFNPHPRFAYAMGLNLLDNAKAQRIDSSSACINKLALAKSKGSVKFNFGYGGGIGVGSTSQAVTVPMTDLDSFFDEYVPQGMRAILIKLDVEAQELEVMKGATKVLQGCRVKHWAIGIHRAHLLAPVKQILTQNGYTIDSAAALVNGQPNGEVFAHC